MSLNRREVLKSGAAGLLLGFLFRGRDGKLSAEPEVADQPPSAVTIRSAPQHAFRPERLVIAGTIVGKRMVSETRFVPCDACDGQRDDIGYDDAICETCDDTGGSLVETGEMVERDVTVVPWTIESMTIGKKPQFAQGGSIPGDLFSVQAVDSFVRLDAAHGGQEIEIVVRYTGDKADGEWFRGALIGTSIGADGAPSREILPISSSQKIVA